MKATKNSRPVIVGIFILLGIVILVVAVFTLGGQKKTFVKGYTVNAVFDDVNGLQAGNNVWLSGVKIGTVRRISFYNNTKVLVSLNLDKSIAPHIHKDAFAKIGAESFIGNKIVVIYGGTNATPQMPEDGFLNVEKATSTDEMLATLQSNNQNLLAITSSFKSISRKIDSGSGTIGYLLNNAAMAKKLNASMNSLQVTMSNFQSASRTSKEVLASLAAFTERLNTEGSLVNKLTTDTTLFNVLKGTLTQLRDVTTTASQITDNLKAASDRLHDTTNVPGILLNDAAAGSAVKNTIMNLENSSQKLNEDLEAVQHNFLLRGYFKKKNRKAEGQ
jgi:phospholipid/cholesterol/gamma-HCH transport system substrate-binding protein